MSIYLVCEGPSDGLDIKVIDLILAQKLNCEILTAPAGGDCSLGSIATWLEERSRTQSPYGTLSLPIDRGYVIEDRNFHSSEQAEETWKPASRRFMWRRHEIENYLLDPCVIADAFQALQEDRVRGADDLPIDHQEVLQLLQDLSRPMLENHAGELTYWELVSSKNEIADTRLLRPNGRLRSGTDSPYPGRTEWLTYLNGECERLKQACRQVSEDTTFDDCIQTYDLILSQIKRPDFLASERFFVDLDGHELMSALCSYVNRVGVANLSRHDFTLELLRALDRLYEPGFFQPDDFAQLKDRLI